MQGVNATQPTADMVANNPSIDDGHKNLIRRYVCLVCVSGCCCELTRGLTTFWGRILVLGIWCLHDVCLKQTEPMYLRICKHWRRKVKIFWERHKIWKIFHLFWNYLVTSKQSGIFYQIFVAFSENLNFNAWKHMYVQECSFRWKFNPIVNPLGICFCLFFKYHLLSPKHLAQRNFYCNSRKFYPSYVQHATNCWISCICLVFHCFTHFQNCIQSCL